jgi:NAD kinase
MDYALVLPPTVTIELAVSTEHQAVLSIDGQVELSLESGDKVKVKSSPYVARFWRVRPVASFYSALERKLKGVVAG